MFATGAATEVLACQQNRSTLVAFLVQHESRVQRTFGVVHARLAMIQITQLVEKIGAKACAFDGFEKLLGYDQVGIDILTVERRYQAMMCSKGLNDGFLSKISYVNKLTDRKSVV